jgi:hypothetical protein
MSKLFKGKTCVYCAVAGAADTGDHVLARELVAVEHRGQIPKVPACAACNGKKSAIEHYLATVLPFGGRHAEALDNLTANVPRRLAKNQKLHRNLYAGTSRVWSTEPSGLVVNTTAVPLDGERLEQLIAFVVRGLMFHHWGVILGPDMLVQAMTLTKHGERFFDGYSKLNAKQRITGDIGKGALVYEGAQGVDNDAISVWQLSLYGGLIMDSGDGNHFMSKFGVMTGPQAIADRAEARVATGKFIIRTSGQ